MWTRMEGIIWEHAVKMDELVQKIKGEQGQGKFPQLG